MPRFPALLRFFLLCTVFAGASGHADPLRIATTQNLAFGAFSAGTGGSVVVSPSGARNATGGVFLLSSSPGSAAQFLVTGNNNQIYTVTLPTAATLVSGSSSMQMVNFASLPSATSASSGLLTGASQVLKVGATLQVASGQLTGLYSGTFNVTVNNN